MPVRPGDIEAVQTYALLSAALLDDVDAYKAQFENLKDARVSLHYLLMVTCKLIDASEQAELGAHLAELVKAMTAELTAE